MNWLNRFLSDTPDAQSPAWDEDVLIIDVRTPGEYASGHVDGAMNLPLDRFAQHYEQAVPDKSRQIVLYCQSGARSGQAAQFLKQQQYEKVTNGGSAGAVAMKANRPVRRH